jgi:predicted ABC-type sugar transport system permease subunit
LFLSVGIFVFFEEFVFMGPIDSLRLKSLAIFLFRSDSVMAFAVSVSMFAMFAYMKPFTNKFINVVSSCTFGVYLIHDNSIIRYLLWRDWLDNNKYYNSPYLVLVLICSTIMVFVVCVLIEYIRQKTIAKPLNKMIYKVFNLIEPKIKSFGQQICDKI